MKRESTLSRLVEKKTGIFSTAIEPSDEEKQNIQHMRLVHKLEKYFQI